MRSALKTIAQPIVANCYVSLSAQERAAVENDPVAIRELVAAKTAEWVEGLAWIYGVRILCYSPSK